VIKFIVGGKLRAEHNHISTQESPTRALIFSAPLWFILVRQHNKAYIVKGKGKGKDKDKDKGTGTGKGENAKEEV
jgi:hypothetical protein